MLGRDTSEDTKARIKGGGLLYPVGISTSAEFGCTSTTKLGIRKSQPFEAAVPAAARFLLRVQLD